MSGWEKGAWAGGRPAATRCVCCSQMHRLFGEQDVKAHPHGSRHLKQFPWFRFYTTCPKRHSKNQRPFATSGGPQISKEL
eukprot:gene20028-biopygen5548